MKVAVTLLSATLAVVSAGAQAAPPTPVSPVPAASVPAPPPNPSVRQPRVEWNPAWPRFRWWEYAGTIGIQAASLYIRYYKPPPDQPKWVGYNPFDDTFRSWLVADTRQGRERAGLVSDRVAFAGSLVPFAVDLPVALLIHGQLRLTWQLMWMDFEAIAVANFLNNTAFYIVGRGRPSSADCAKDPNYDRLCGGTGNNASLPSGHTVTIATATGLVCVHHKYLPLYGNDAADDLACVVMALATITTGVTRIMADRHFTSDVIFGATIGFASGYGLPRLLHYRRGDSEPKRTALVLPFAADGGFGLGVVGLL